MADFVIPASALAAHVEKSVEELRDDLVETIRTTVKLHAPRVVQELISAEPQPPVFRGTYRRSFKVGDVPDGAVLYNFAPHAPIIEKGRRPGSKAPPTAVIADWVRRRGIGMQRGPVGYKFRNKRGYRSERVAVRARRLSPSEAHRIAFVIARAIGRRGQKGHHILDRAQAALAPIVSRALEERLAGGHGE